jgi:hypothetical protein
MNFDDEEGPRLNVGPRKVACAMSSSMLVLHHMAPMIGGTWMPRGSEVAMVIFGLGNFGRP